MIARIDAESNFLADIVFCVEATFTSTGKVNRHNCCVWSDINLHWIREAHTQYPQKLNVWVGMSDNTVIGPFFSDGDLTAERYKNILRD